MDAKQKKIDEIVEHVKSMQSHYWDDGGLTRDCDYEELEAMLHDLSKLDLSKLKVKKTKKKVTRK